jgi:SCP-2 sterol transfer family protein
MNDPFDPVTLADDLYEVRRIYAAFFAGLDLAAWEKAIKGGAKEWNLHQTIAHLTALTGYGFESIQAALRGQTYLFPGLENRYQFDDFNRHGIDEHLSLPMEDLCARFLRILDQEIEIARCLQPCQVEMTSEMAIYNRPVKIVEALGIIVLHAGVIHAAQVTEPAGVPPLWKQLSPEIRHRMIGRTMRAQSLLYRYDLGGSLKAVVAFRVDGPGGGNWHINLSPETTSSDEGMVDHAALTIHLHETAVFCQMLSGRLNLPAALLTGQFKLRGDPRLFLRLNTLFSVDARR